jgi:hypothetical protein
MEDASGAKKEMRIRHKDTDNGKTMTKIERKSKIG